MKTLEQHFCDWECSAFGFGYGTGEEHVIGALKSFFELCNKGDGLRAYDHKDIEKELSPATAWLLINKLCSLDAIEYGTSPRYAWLTKKGERLKEFFGKHSTEELLNILWENFETCGDSSPKEDNPPTNPFWHDSI